MEAEIKNPNENAASETFDKVRNSNKKLTGENFEHSGIKTLLEDKAPGIVNNRNDLDESMDTSVKIETDSFPGVAETDSAISDDDFQDILQECPLCHKMFMKKDYEQYHIYTHQGIGKDMSVVESINVKSTDAGKADLNANEVWEDTSIESFEKDAVENNEYANPLKEGKLENETQFKANISSIQNPKSNEQPNGKEDFRSHPKVDVEKMEVETISDAEIAVSANTEEHTAAILKAAAYDVRKSIQPMEKEPINVHPKIKVENMEVDSSSGADLPVSMVTENGSSSGLMALGRVQPGCTLPNAIKPEETGTNLLNDTNDIDYRERIIQNINRFIETQLTNSGSDKTFGKCIDSKSAAVQVHHSLKQELPECRVVMTGQRELDELMKKRNKRDVEKLYGPGRKEALQKRLTLMAKNLKPCLLCYRLIDGKDRLDTHMKTHHSEIPKLSTNTTKLDIQDNHMLLGNDMQSQSFPFELVSSKSQLKEQKEIQRSKNLLEKETMHWNDTLAGMSVDSNDSFDNSSDKYECPICFRKLIGRHHLDSHMNEHKDEKSLKYQQKFPKCSKTVAGEHKLKAHMNTHDKTDNPYERPRNCYRKRYSSPMSGKEHMDSNENTLGKEGSPSIGKRQHKCSICSYVVAGEQRFMEHMTTHENGIEAPPLDAEWKEDTDSDNDKPNLFQCQICLKMISGKFRYKLHMETHTSSGSHSTVLVECAICKILLKMKELYKHMQAVHTPNRPFTCQICSASYVRCERLVEHHEKYHPGRNLKFPSGSNSRRYTNTQRQKLEVEENQKFPSGSNSSRYTYTQRQKLEVEENQKFPSGSNSSRYTQRQKLEVEENLKFPRGSNSSRYTFTKKEKVEVEEKVKINLLHSCKQCGKQFHKEDSLKRHAAVHRLMRKRKHTFWDDPVTCEICGKTLSQAKSLKAHMSIHKGRGEQLYSLWLKRKAEETKNQGSVKHGGESKNQYSLLKQRIEKTENQPSIKHTGDSKNQLSSLKQRTGKNQNKRSVKPMFRPTLVPCKNNTPDVTDSDSDTEFVPHKIKKPKESIIQRVGHSPRRSNCKFCGEAFDSKLDLIKHLKVHSEGD